MTTKDKSKGRTPMTRRSFVKRSCALPFLGYGSLVVNSTAQAAVCDASDRRSLVCVFLLGGADSFSFVVRGGNHYDTYRQTRGDLAVAESDLLLADSAQGELGFNAGLDNLHALYQTRQLAVVSNLGNLIRPTTQSQFINKTVPLPQSLFAHDAQQKLWQTARGDLAQSLGWGGGIAEQLAYCNPDSNVSTSISIAGSNSWLTNLHANYISLQATSSIERLIGYDIGANAGVREALSGLLGDARSNANALYEQQVAEAIARSVDTAGGLEDALAAHPVSNMSFSNTNTLAGQLHMVARLISAREQLNMRRQVFFVTLGGWDTHSNQNERLVPLLADLNEALGSFQDAIDDMGLSDSVTTFTASDFGRTLTSNGDGTDHGWGGNALVMGGAVNGRQVYGDFADMSTQNNADDASDGDGRFAGRIIPKVSVGQYGATLARWMGVSDQERDAIFPELVNFAQKDLGFMRG